MSIISQFFKKTVGRDKYILNSFTKQYSLLAHYIAARITKLKHKLYHVDVEFSFSQQLCLYTLNKIHTLHKYLNAMAPDYFFYLFLYS